MKKQIMKTGAKAGTYSAVLTLIVVAAAIVVNLIVGALPAKFTKIDTSADSVFTFSAETEKYVASLTKDVTVYHICEEGAEDTYLTEILARYKDMSSHIKTEKIDPAKNPALIEKYTDQSLASNSLIIVHGETAKVVPYGEIYYIYCEALGGKMSYDKFNEMNQYYYYQTGYTLEEYYYYQTGTQLIYTVNFAGENAIVSGIDYVTSDYLPKIYVLGSNSEAQLNSVLTSIFKSENYVVDVLALSEGGDGLEGGASVMKDIPADADTIIIYGLESDITAEELALLQKYVRDGGKLIIATNYTSTEFANLRSLASGFGLDISTSVVLEENSAYYSGSKFNIKATIGSNGPLANFPYDVMITRAHGIKVAQTMPEGMKATQLLSTSDSAYAKPIGYDPSQKLDKAEGDIAGPFALGVLVECEGAGSVAWFSSDYYLINEFSSYHQSYNDFVKFNYAYAQTAAALCNKIETLTVDAVELTSSYLSVTEGAATMWGIITIGIIPIAFIGIGFTVWMRRRSK